MGYNVQSNSQCYQFPKEGKNSKLWVTQLEVNGPTNFAFIYRSLWASGRKYEGALQGYILYGVLNVWKFHQVYAYDLHKLFCWYIIWKCQLKFACLAFFSLRRKKSSPGKFRYTFMGHNRTIS